MNGVDPRPRVVCFYDQGAASPSEIARALTPWTQLLVVLADKPTSSEDAELFTSLGVDLRDTPPHDVDAAVTFSERALDHYAAFIADAGLRGHTVDVARRLQDKWEQRECLRLAGVDTLDHRLVAHPRDLADAAVDLGFPVIVKPCRGSASRNAHPLSNAADAERVQAVLLDRARRLGDGGYEPHVLERMLMGRDCTPHGDYVSVEVAVADGSPHAVAVLGKIEQLPPFREPGQFWPAALEVGEREAVVDLAARAAVALGAQDAVLHIEIKRCADGPRVIEVNGRLGGFVGELLQRACGYDLISAATSIALGRWSPQHLPEASAAAASSAVWFQYHNLVPPGIARVLSAGYPDGIPPEVSGYSVLVPVRKRLGQGVQTGELDLSAGVVSGGGAALTATLDDLRAAVRIDVQFADGAIGTLTGDQVRTMNLGMGAGE